MRNKVIPRNGLLANYIGVAVSVMVAGVAGCRGGDEERRNIENVPFPLHLTTSINPFFNEKNSGEEGATFAPPNMIYWTSADEPGICFKNLRDPLVISTPREYMRRTNKRLLRSFVPWKWSWRKKEVNRGKNQESTPNPTVLSFTDKSSREIIVKPLTTHSLKTKVTSTSTQSSSAGILKIPPGLVNVIEKLKYVSSTKPREVPFLTSTHSFSTTNHEACPFNGTLSYDNNNRNVSSSCMKKKNSITNSSTSTSASTLETNPGKNLTEGLGEKTISSTMGSVSASGNRSIKQPLRSSVEDKHTQITSPSIAHLARKRRKQLRKKIVHMLHRKAPWMFAQKSMVLSKTFKVKDGFKESTSIRTEKSFEKKIGNGTKTI